MDSDVRDRQDEQEEENRRKNTHTNQPYPSTFNKKTCCDCTSANTDQNLCDLCKLLENTLDFSSLKTLFVVKTSLRFLCLLLM